MWIEKTKNCVRCFKPAIRWTGHILKDGERIMAGWCDDCWYDGKPTKKAEGFSGHYTRKMGIKKK